MKVAFLVGLLSVPLAARGAEPPASLTRYRCYFCHSDRERLTGPAFAEVAASYREQSGAVTTIANNIRTGIQSGGPWHMPPHPEVSEADARSMARYILALKK